MTNEYLFVVKVIKVYRDNTTLLDEKRLKTE